MSFKPSINVRLDLGNDEFLDRYLPSSSHMEALKGLLNGMQGKSNSSHIIVGPYGTGKSLIATILGGIASKTVSKESIKNLTEKFSEVDDNIASLMEFQYEKEKDYLPVVLSGNNGRFRTSLISSMINMLLDKGIEVSLPGTSSEILKVVSVWEDEFPDTFEVFKSMLFENGLDYEVWVSKVSRSDKSSEEVFREIYPKISSGAKFNVEFNSDFVESLEIIFNKMEENDLGAFIVYDEFGRFLQGLDNQDINETMQDLQDLAEIVNRNKYVSVALITHKSLRQYFGGFNEEISKEFQRIEKRYTQYFIKNDQSTFIQLAKSIISGIKGKEIITDKNKEKILEGIRKLPIFLELNQTEKEKVLVEGVYPLHPVSLFLLPELSSVFGQNERTLFTFLESNDTGGFKNHIDKSSSMYYPHQLFDYFFRDVESELDGESYSEYALKYKKIVGQLPSDFTNIDEAINLIKLVTLWEVCGLQQKCKISNYFIGYALNLDVEKVENLLSELVRYKIIRFNVIKNYWETFSGSSVDIVKNIEEMQKTRTFSDSELLSVLNNSLKKKYYYPYEYNDDKSMSRFSNVECTFIDNLDLSARTEHLESDFSIKYIIAKEEKEVSIIDKKLKKNVDKTSVFALGLRTLKDISNVIREYLILKELASTQEFISKDKLLVDEINILQQEALFKINKFLLNFEGFTSETKWFYNGVEESVSSDLELSKLLSKIGFDVYELTPVVTNDAFNRKIISGAQRKALCKVFDSIVSNYYNDKFSISGSGPDYLIYASVFKNNDAFDQNVNRLDYSPDSIGNEYFRGLRVELTSLLKDNPKGKLKDLVSILEMPPYGVRKPLIPILLVGLLRDYWNDIMFYQNDMFVTGLNGEKFVQMVDQSENFQYVFQPINENQLVFINKLEGDFSEYKNEELEGQSRLVSVCYSLLNWQRKLPRITQLSTDVKREYDSLRKLIRRTEVKPQASLNALFKKYSDDYDKFTRLIAYAESFASKYEDSVIATLLKETKVSDFKELHDWANSLDDIVKQKNNLIKSLVSVKLLDSNKDNLRRFTSKYVGVSPKNWTDSTQTLFLSQLANDFENASQEVSENDSEMFVTLRLNDEVKVIEKQELTTKGKTIYSNVSRILDRAGKDITEEEKRFLVLKLIEEFIE